MICRHTLAGCGNELHFLFCWLFQRAQNSINIVKIALTGKGCAECRAGVSVKLYLWRDIEFSHKKLGIEFGLVYEWRQQGNFEIFRPPLPLLPPPPSILLYSLPSILLSHSLDSIFIILVETVSIRSNLHRFLTPPPPPALNVSAFFDEPLIELSC